MSSKSLRLSVFVFLIFSLLILGCARNTKVDEIDKFLSYCSENGMFNGTICIMEGDEIIYKSAFGIADESKNEKLTTSHAFYLASVSKQFTTMAVMILKERGVLNYDDNLRMYFPEFPPYADNVKIENLMTHTSGIPDHFRLGAEKPDLTNNEVLELLIKQDSLDFQPGENSIYSNGAYVLLALIVEKASGQPFHVFMKENIFDPLDMNNSLVYDESKPEISPRVIGYNMFGKIADYNILTSGAGGIYSTIEDLAKWNKALYDVKLVSQETLSEAYTSFKLNNDSLTHYGYGWSVRNDSLGNRVYHSGGLAGFRTYLERNLDTKISFFYLTNYGNSLPMGAINEGIRDILGGKRYSLPKIPISKALLGLIRSEGIEKAVDSYRKLKKSEAEKPSIQMRIFFFMSVVSLVCDKFISG
ncbi:MAG: serine hydrolase domain-containing protein [Melioribacteraceae bacterium]|nr:serine hydrolase domain-containing protein [Melioribacteraceae bacterium]